MKFNNKNSEKLTFFYVTATVIFIGMAIALANQILGHVVTINIPKGNAYFPCRIADTLHAGSPMNLIGVGNFNHQGTLGDGLRGLVLAILLLIVRVRYEVIKQVVPLWFIAAGAANSFELAAVSNVFDWIVVPLGGNNIRSVSIGDLLLFAGAVLLVGRLVRLAAIDVAK
jgi:hypothetical protein